VIWLPALKRRQRFYFPFVFRPFTKQPGPFHCFCSGCKNKNADLSISFSSRCFLDSYNIGATIPLFLQRLQK